MPPVAGADLRACLVASWCLGALPPVHLRAVCFVLAMVVVVLLWGGVGLSIVTVCLENKLWVLCWMIYSAFSSDIALRVIQGHNLGTAHRQSVGNKQ